MEKNIVVIPSINSVQEDLVVNYDCSSNSKNDSDEKEQSTLVKVRELALANNGSISLNNDGGESLSHEKTFHVSLKIENETWIGEGTSIKKAQNDACTLALKESKLLKAKTSTKKTKIANPLSITPTVRLNGLAMALGETVTYRVINKIPLPCQPVYSSCTSYNHVNNFYSNYSLQGRPYSSKYNGYMNGNNYLGRNQPVERWIHPYFYRIQVNIGEYTFQGEGKTQQEARHDAANHALEILSKLPIPKRAKELNKSRANVSGTNGTTDQSVTESNEGNMAQVKSSISELHEKASVHKLHIEFHVVSEIGPPHLKVFTVEVNIHGSVNESKLNGPINVDVTANGQGPNKKVAKARAASNALEKIKDIPLPRHKSKSYKSPKVSNGNGKVERAVHESLHPVSRLSQIMQAKKEKEPEFLLISSEKIELKSRLNKFVVKCTVQDEETSGEGLSKKEAKRAAAENMLKKLKIMSVKEETGSSADESKSATKRRTTLEQSSKCNKPQRVIFGRARSNHCSLPTVLEI